MAGFGKTPTTTTQGSLATNQFPASSVYPPNKGGSNPTDDFFVLEGGPITTDDDGNKSAPAGLYIKDGGDVTKGTQADTAWSGSGSATEIAILKKLVALLTTALTVSGTVTANAGTNMSTAALALETGGALSTIVTNTGNIPVKGQTAMVDSAPMVIASDQTPVKAIPYKQVSSAIYSTTQTGVTTWTGSGDIPGLSGFSELFLNISFTAFSGTSVQFKVLRKDSFGNYITIDSGLTVTATGSQSRSIGSGMNINQSFGSIIQVQTVFISATVTFTLDVSAK